MQINSSHFVLPTTSLMLSRRWYLLFQYRFLTQFNFSLFIDIIEIVLVVVSKLFLLLICLAQLCPFDLCIVVCLLLVLGTSANHKQEGSSRRQTRSGTLNLQECRLSDLFCIARSRRNVSSNFPIVDSVSFPFLSRTFFYGH